MADKFKIQDFDKQMEEIRQRHRGGGQSPLIRLRDAIRRTGKIRKPRI